MRVGKQCGRGSYGVMHVYTMTRRYFAAMIPALGTRPLPASVDKRFLT